MSFIWCSINLRISLFSTSSLKFLTLSMLKTGFRWKKMSTSSKTALDTLELGTFSMTVTSSLRVTNTRIMNPCKIDSTDLSRMQYSFYMILMRYFWNIRNIQPSLSAKVMLNTNLSILTWLNSVYHQNEQMMWESTPSLL